MNYCFLLFAFFCDAYFHKKNFFLFQKAEAQLAYELQAAKTKQRIKEEQMQIKVIERTQEILVQVREANCIRYVFNVTIKFTAI